MSENPYESPTAAPPAADEEAIVVPHGGIGRLAYWIALPVLCWVFFYWMEDRESPPNPMSPIFFWIACMIPGAVRLKNMGAHPAWALGMIIPLYNVFIIFRCLTYQEGFYPRKKLDDIGKFLVALLVLLVAGAVGFAIIEAGRPPQL